jgi:hypothetical protein
MESANLPRLYPVLLGYKSELDFYVRNLCHASSPAPIQSLIHLGRINKNPPFEIIRKCLLVQQDIWILELLVESILMLLDRRNNLNSQLSMPVFPSIATTYAVQVPVPGQDDHSGVCMPVNCRVSMVVYRRCVDTLVIGTVALGDARFVLLAFARDLVANSA